MSGQGTPARGAAEDECLTPEERERFARQMRALPRWGLAAVLLPTLANAALLVCRQVPSHPWRLALAIAAGVLLAVAVAVGVGYWRAWRRMKGEWGEATDEEAPAR